MPKPLATACFFPSCKPCTKTCISTRTRIFHREEKIIKLLIKDLNEITAAVETGDSEKARSLMQRHVHKFNRLAEEGQRKMEESA